MIEPTSAVNIGLGILPLLSVLFTFLPLIVGIWFMIKTISLQKERNKILRSISEKLDK